MLSFLVSILLFVVVPLFCAVYVWVEFFSSPDDHAFRARFLGQTRMMKRKLVSSVRSSSAARTPAAVPTSPIFAPNGTSSSSSGYVGQSDTGTGDVEERVNELDDRLTGMNYRVEELDTRVGSVDTRASELETQIQQVCARQDEQQECLDQVGSGAPEESIAEMEARMADVMRTAEERIMNTNIVAQRVDDVMLKQRDMEGRIVAMGGEAPADENPITEMENEVRELSSFVRELQGQLENVMQCFDRGGDSAGSDGAPFEDQVGSIQHALGNVEFRLSNCEAQGNQFESILRETRSMVDEMRPMMTLLTESMDEKPKSRRRSTSKKPASRSSRKATSKRKTTAKKSTSKKKSAAKKPASKKPAGKTTAKKATKASSSRRSSAKKPAASKSRSRRRDDLTQITGIGPAVEETLNSLGIRNFQHLANLSTDDIEQITEKVSGVGNKIRKQRWVQQASKLLKG